jgi:lysozyme
MTISSKGIDLITTFEGYRDKAYKDGAGIWTIGYGTIRVNSKPVMEGMTCIQEQAKEWFRDSVSETEKYITKLCATQLTQNQFDALVSLVYNIGIGNFISSTLCKKLNNPNLGPSTVTEENFTSWNKIRSNGVLVESKGLTRRRIAEYKLFVAQ